MKNSTTKPTKELAKITEPDNSPAGLIAKAIESNITPEALEKLMGLQERWERNEAKKAYDSAMAAFQAECPTINKGKPVLNKDGTERYRFATIDSIIEQVKPLLQKHGFSYAVDVKYENKVMISICKITHIQGHSETSSFPSPIDPDAYMNEAQKFASASTFAKRYAFLNAFGIMTGDEDDDSAATGAEVAPRANSGDKPAYKATAGKAKVNWVPSKNGTCPICGQKAKWGEGEKAGKTWAGLFCQNPECKHVAWQTNTPYNQHLIEDAENEEKRKFMQDDLPIVEDNK